MAESEKAFKITEHRRERRAVHAAISGDLPVPDAKRYGNPWAGPKDGRQYLRKPNERLMRK